MQLSIITSTYNSSETINGFFSKLNSSIKELKLNDYEIIVVDDGSTDNTIKNLTELKKNNPKIKVVELSRNFGHHKALLTGIKVSIGDYTFLIDSDLEEDPSNLTLFYNKITKSENDMIFGIQERRKADFFKNLTGSFFYKFFNALSTLKIPQDVMTITIFNKKIKEAIKLYNETEIFLHGILHTVGFSKESVVIKKGYKGKSHYNVIKKIDLFTEAIVSFSSLPLKLLFLLGFFITFFSSVYIIWLLLIKIINKTAILPGFTTIMISITFFGGLIISAIGILGIYLSKTYLEVKRRPQVIIKKIH
jgi:putative glycosyltransferase